MVPSPPGTAAVLGAEPRAEMVPTRPCPGKCSPSQHLQPRCLQTPPRCKEQVLSFWVITPQNGAARGRRHAEKPREKPCAG